MLFRSNNNVRNLVRFTYTNLIWNAADMVECSGESCKRAQCRKSGSWCSDFQSVGMVEVPLQIRRVWRARLVDSRILSSRLRVLICGDNLFGLGAGRSNRFVSEEDTCFKHVCALVFLLLTGKSLLRLISFRELFLYLKVSNFEKNEEDFFWPQQVW